MANFARQAPLVGISADTPAKVAIRLATVITTDKRAWEIGRSLDFVLFMVLQMIFKIRVEDFGANGTQCIFIAGRGAENRPSVLISAGTLLIGSDKNAANTKAAWAINRSNY